MKKKRICLGIEYDGSAYHGWQTQTDLPTVQENLEKALSQVANHPVAVITAGRTDASVHASEQIVHFDTTTERDNDAWVLGSNANLPADISVRWAQPVSDEFHARFSAVTRSYRYVIYNHAIRPAIMRHLVTWHYRELNINLMQQGAQYLIGEHDFSAFRTSQCQAHSPVRTIEKLEISREKDLVIINITANAFLHHMVRNIAGVLMPIGAGLKPPDWAQQVLQKRDRSQGGVTATGQGLYLTKVTYPAKFGLPENSVELALL